MDPPPVPAEARIVPNPQVGDDITLGAFWVRCERNGRPGSVEIAGEEERLHAPWFAPHQ